MKPTIPLLLALAAGCIPPALRAEEPATDRSPSKPIWNVRPDEILESKTIHQGGRSVVIREITPGELPLPPEPRARPQHNALLRERAEAFRNKHPRRHLLPLSATVYKAADTPPRTYVRIPGDATRGPVEFWSSGDFSILSHSIGEIPGPDHEIFLLMVVGIMDMDRLAAFATRGGRIYQRPEIPEFPEGGPAFHLISGEPDEDLLAGIQRIHDHLETNRETLQANRLIREANHARERGKQLEIKEPRNLTLNYWRVPPTGKGGGQ